MFMNTNVCSFWCRKKSPKAYPDIDCNFTVCVDTNFVLELAKIYSLATRFLFAEYTNEY